MPDDIATEQATAETGSDARPDSAPDEPANEPSAGESPADQDKPKKRRRRRRRGGRGRGKGKGGDKPAAAESAPADGHADQPARSDDEPAESPAPRRKSKPVETSGKASAELFAEGTFDDLGLRNSVLKGVHAAGFEKPTIIQSQIIPAALSGRDVLGQARTGSGKTAAFGLPLFNNAQRALPFQAIVLVPTRELAIQITGELRELGQFTPIRVCAVYGGEPIDKQRKRLDEGPEIVVATPGRLMDLVERRILHLNNVRVAVLDEVDRMLDIGFRDDIRKILGMVKTEHQTIFVSATIGEEIERLARKFMSEPERITAVAGSLTVDLVEQHYLSVERWDKKPLLLHLLRHEEPALTLVFCRTKRMVDQLTKYLKDKGIDAFAIHGDMQQGKRNAVMNRFRSGGLSVLVASDLAARGIDVENISHVVNYDLPEDPEIYIHRIGRTARAGRGGIAWAFVSPDEGHLLTAIEKLANVEIPLMDYPGFKPSPPPEGARREQRPERKPDEPVSTSSDRFGPPPPPKPTQADSNRFPGGLVPTKLPPRTFGGRVRTSRSMKEAGPPSEAGLDND